MTAFAVIFSVMMGISPTFGDEMSSGSGSAGTDGIIESFPNMFQAMGLEYDSVHGFLWQATQDTGRVYTVDPSTGAYQVRFNINDYFGTDVLMSNGIYLDETLNYLYLADFNGDAGTTFGDCIYCFDVDDPNSPTLVDMWDFTTFDGLLGMTYKDPYYYCNFYSAGEMRIYTLEAGGAFTLEDYVSGVSYGGLWYDDNWNVFYTHDALGDNVHVLNGDDPSDILDTFTPGCTMDCGITDDSNPAILWVSDRDPDLNYKIDDEYVPEALTNSTWGNIKTAF